MSMKTETITLERKRWMEKDLVIKIAVETAITVM
jgi:hypothetical protein